LNFALFYHFFFHNARGEEEKIKEFSAIFCGKYLLSPLLRDKMAEES